MAFCSECGIEMSSEAWACPKCGKPTGIGGKSTGTKSKVTAALLAFFLGGIGIHKFYFGETSKGVLFLLFCWTGIPAILALIDFCILLGMPEEEFNVKY
ncbi:MAG: NINE protein [Brevinema sp.]